MKRKTIAYTAALLLALSPLMLAGQNPPLPNGGSNPSGGNSPIGGGASLGGGLITMLALAAGYGTKKIYNGRKRIME